MPNIFGRLEHESVVQINDKTRLDASKSFSAKGESSIEQVKISPEVGADLIPVHGNGNPKEWFLDWEYQTDGTKTITLQIKAGPHTVQFTYEIEVVTSDQDKLFSSDPDLTSFEPDILKWVQPGRSSFLNIHRTSQALILEWLDSIRLWRKDGSKLTKEDISFTDDLKQLSTYLTLMLIFRGLSNKVDDVFAQKARDYEMKSLDVKNRGRIQADFNGDGELTVDENEDQRSYWMVRR